MKFNVLRRHQGDRLYEEGDTRDAAEPDVVHLVEAGVLRPVGKTAPSVRNKAAPRNANKKAPATKNKDK